MWHLIPCSDNTGSHQQTANDSSGGGGGGSLDGETTKQEPPDSPDMDLDMEINGQTGVTTPKLPDTPPHSQSMFTELQKPSPLPTNNMMPGLMSAHGGHGGGGPPGHPNVNNNDVGGMLADYQSL